MQRAGLPLPEDDDGMVMGLSTERLGSETG